MEKRNVYEKVEAFAGGRALPVDGYVCRITDAEEVTTEYQGVETTRLLLVFDIAEGEYQNYYMEKFRNSTFDNDKYKGVFRNLYVPKDDGSEEDERTARSFKTKMNAIEESNDGFHWDWDEKKLIGKLVGIVFRSKEWEMNDKRGFFTEPYWITSVNNIRTNNFKLPDTKYLDNNTSGTDGFVAVDNAEVPDFA